MRITWESSFIWIIRAFLEISSLSFWHLATQSIEILNDNNNRKTRIYQIVQFSCRDEVSPNVFVRTEFENRTLFFIFYRSLEFYTRSKSEKHRYFAIAQWSVIFYFVLAEWKLLLEFLCESDLKLEPSLVFRKCLSNGKKFFWHQGLQIISSVSIFFVKFFLRKRFDEQFW